MALSDALKKRLVIAVTDSTLGEELADAVDAGDGSQPGLLASTDTGEGASLVGIKDAATVYTAETVEAALAEVKLIADTAAARSKYDMALLADPGGANAAIPVTRSATIAITTAAAETNTLAVPAFVGQMLTLSMTVRAVGDRVVTVASAINNSPGDTIMTFGAAGDWITLVGVTIAGVRCWRVLANEGVALS